MPPDQFLDLIHLARRARDDGLVVQMPLNVRGQAIGGLVPPIAVLLQASGHNPVQVTPHVVEESCRFRRAALRCRRQVGRAQRVQPRRGPRRLLLADGAPDFVNARRQQSVRVERQPARQQFVKQHAHAVDVTARIDVQAC